MRSCHKNEVHQHSILDSTLFLLYINDLSDDCICNIAIYTDDTTLYSKWEQASDLWQQLKLASDFWPTRHLGRKWLFDFNPWKLNLFCSTSLTTLVLKSPFKIPELSFSSKFNLGSHIISIAKTASKKIGALICSMKFLFP